MDTPFLGDPCSSKPNPATLKVSQQWLWTISLMSTSCYLPLGLTTLIRKEAKILLLAKMHATAKINSFKWGCPERHWVTIGSLQMRQVPLRLEKGGLLFLQVDPSEVILVLGFLEGLGIPGLPSTTGQVSVMLGRLNCHGKVETVL